jgi:hypothetical protein
MGALAVAILALVFGFGFALFLMYYSGSGQRRHLVIAIICGVALIAALTGAVLMIRRLI